MSQLILFAAARVRVKEKITIREAQGIRHIFAVSRAAVVTSICIVSDNSGQFIIFSVFFCCNNKIKRTLQQTLIHTTYSWWVIITQKQCAEQKNNWIQTNLLELANICILQLF